MASGATNHVASRLAPNIRAARLAAGLTQQQLAVRLGLGRTQSVSNWERGESRPSEENMAALAQVLDRPLAWFYSDHEAA